MKSFQTWREDKFTESQPPEKKNKEGGFDPTPEQKAKWEKADLITLPMAVQKQGGTNCGNCTYYTKKNEEVGFCTFKELLCFVSKVQCCKWWDNPEVKRIWNA
jgi:hypothetical protein